LYRYSGAGIRWSRGRFRLGGERRKEGKEERKKLMMMTMMMMMMRQGREKGKGHRSGSVGQGMWGRD